MVTDEEFIRVRTRVLHLEGQVAFLFKQLNMTFVPEEKAGDDPRVVEFLKNGKVIDAVKLYREINDSPLVEATQAIEEMRARLGI